MKSAEEMRAEGAAMTAAAVAHIAAKFRTEIGGVYGFVAMCIEVDHAGAQR